MQNYEQILQELGIEIPEDKKVELKKKMGENYKTINDYKNVAEKRDEYKKSLDEVQGKLDGFKDVDVEDLKNQITTLTADLANEKAARASDAEKAEREKTVNTFLASVDEKGEKLYDFLNEITENHYRELLIEELGKDSAKGKSIKDIFAQMITGEDGKEMPGIFVNKTEANKAKFTAPNAGGSHLGTGKKLSEMSLDERIELKSKDPDLYKSLRKGD